MIIIVLSRPNKCRLPFRLIFGFGKLYINRDVLLVITYFMSFEIDCRVFQNYL
jgi:hypothetical protein